MGEHPHLETIRRYYSGCNAGDVELMISTFTPDVVHYFPNFPPQRGALELANHWARFQKSGKSTRWTVDHGIVEGDEAVIEWTMEMTGPGIKEGWVLRGSEWYVFRNGKIAEVRAYYHLAPETVVSELGEFPYDARGYATAGQG